MRISPDRPSFGSRSVPLFLAAVAAATACLPAAAADRLDPHEAAARIDRLILEEIGGTAEVAPPAGDEDFLRRVTFDLAGTAPSPRDVTLFGLDPDSRKREKLIDRLLASDDFAANWARYWRDVIFTRATDMRARLMEPTFEQWMTEQLKAGRRWNEIATDLLTATGDVGENGATALMFAHGADASEIAAEVSRIFLGIQLQCANCHDHPTDPWKREQFHELAAFFPRMRVQIRMDQQPRTFEIVSADGGRGGPGGGGFNPLANLDTIFRNLDRNRDDKLSKAEVQDSPLPGLFDRLGERADANKDGMFSRAELKEVAERFRQFGTGRGRGEHFMPDLDNPASPGVRMDPVFFVSEERIAEGLRDVERRVALAKLITSPDNPWFARSIVNRVWSEMLGEGFVMPIDDMGPERPVQFPKVLDLLSEGFVASGYDLRWLMRTIAGTAAYQRQIRAQDITGTTPPFAAAMPTRLRADQLYDAITNVLGTGDTGAAPQGRRFGGPYGRGRSPRQQFATLFAFDPSTPQEDITGTVPQALFLMNSPLLNSQIRGDGNTRLATILRECPDNEDALSELYLLVLSREPSEKELRICREYLKETPNRREAFEDLMWSLLNSSEFVSKR